MAQLLDIGEVASLSGMPASTLRYYERAGIVASVERKGLRRQYRPEVLETLAVVALCRRTGFNLAEIKELLATRGHPPVRALAAQKRDQLRDQARQLTLLADLIDHFVDCPGANAFECEHFQHVLRHGLPLEVGPVAATGGIRPHPSAAPAGETSRARPRAARGAA
jgi:DNA-binding transcriptional MerR regulator